MIDPETTFTPDGCRRCGALVLVGSCDGLRWRMAGRSVPPEHGVILKRYGVTLLMLDVSASGAVWADVWEPAQHDLTDRYLVAPHVCGAAINELEA